MSSDKDKAREELRALQADLKAAKLSRRGFLTRVQALGLGFGAAVALGIREADAAPSARGELRLRSDNPTVDGIIEEARQEREGETQLAQYYGRRYGRVVYGRYGRYARIYGRGYARYGRVYGRYGRVYGRYGRVYGRIL